MPWPQCNSTLEDMKIAEPPLFDSHDFTFHRLTIYISAICGLIAIVISLFLMAMHTTHYSRPKEQRHIIRILFMVPVYAMVSFLSIVFYNHSVYYEVLRDCYEAFAIASFFSLMCAYIAEDLHSQKEYFRKVKPKGWIWPMRWLQKCTGGEHGMLRTPRSGLTWFNVIWVCVFQYCFIRVSMTIVAVLTQYFDRYCLESLNPAFSHVWVMVIEGVAVTITMYCLIQFYYQIREDIAQHKPILKVLAIKLVIFLSFWQTIVISFLTSSGAINASPKIQTPDIKVGIPSMLLCIEMALFAFFHIWSFSYRPYVIGSKRHQEIYGGINEAQPVYHGGFLGIKAIIECFNPWDLIKATGRSAKWLFKGRKNRMQDSSYATVGESQKMNDLDAPTAYGGGSKVKDDAGAGLLVTGPARNTHLNPYAARESDSSGNSPWTEVEAKEYFQDEQMRKQNPRRDDVPTPYDTVYHETGYPPQRTDARPAAPQQSLPFVTRQDIEDVRYTRNQAPNTRPPGASGRGDEGGFI